GIALEKGMLRSPFNIADGAQSVIRPIHAVRPRENGSVDRTARRAKIEETLDLTEITLEVIEPISFNPPGAPDAHRIRNRNRAGQNGGHPQAEFFGVITHVHIRVCHQRHVSPILGGHLGKRVSSEYDWQAALADDMGREVETKIARGAGHGAKPRGA